MLEGPPDQLPARHLDVPAEDHADHEPGPQRRVGVDDVLQEEVEHRRALGVADDYKGPIAQLVGEEILETGPDAVISGHRLGRAEVQVRVRHEVGQGDLAVDGRVYLADRGER